MNARPLVKWAGGKSKLISQFQPLFPGSLAGRRYVEPFVGSGAVFFWAQADLRPSSALLLDANAELVGVYCDVRDRLEDLSALLCDYDRRHNGRGVTDAERRILYYAVREEEPALGTVERSARFIYLNKTCFNGLFRVNAKGRFNVPMGSYSSPSIWDPDNLTAVSLALQGVEIRVADFRLLATLARPSDFVYLDPPYHPLSTTSSFTSYTRGGFSAKDQEDLRDLVAGLPCQWALSNSSAPLIEALYDRPGWTKHPISAARGINSKATGRGRIRELLVTRD